jgi:hypothetical protein
MSQKGPEKILAGTKVEPGVYRCNACANEHESREVGQELPVCSACDSISWRHYCALDNSKKK